MFNIYVKVTVGNTAIAGVNYKELYDLNGILGHLRTIHCIKRHLNFYKYLGLMMACIGRK